MNIGAARLASSPATEPLPYAVAKAYLGAAFDFFSQDGLAAFLTGFQEIHEMRMGDLWALKPALQSLLIERIAQATKTPAVSLATDLQACARSANATGKICSNWSAS